MKKLVCIVITIFIISSFKGQSIKIDTNKVYTLNPITESIFYSNEDHKTINLNHVFIDKKAPINNVGFKVTQHEISNGESFIGEVAYWMLIVFTTL